MIYVILGMHKSGTTLISRMFHESGINMGQFESSISYDQGNQYERKDFQEINKAILGCGNDHSTKVIHPLMDNYQNEVIKADVIKKIAELDTLYSQWGFKDPRTCLTYDFWSNHLPKHKMIYIYRTPIEIWNHYQKHIPKYRLIKRFLAGGQAVKAWYIYNNQLINFMKKTEGSDYIIEYSEFMQQKESIEKLSSFTKCTLKDSRDISLYRAKNIKSLGYNLYIKVAKIFLGFNPHDLYTELHENKSKRISNL